MTGLLSIYIFSFQHTNLRRFLIEVLRYYVGFFAKGLFCLVIPVLVLLFAALWFILWGDLFYVLHS